MMMPSLGNRGRVHSLRSLIFRLDVLILNASFLLRSQVVCFLCLPLAIDFVII